MAKKFSYLTHLFFGALALTIALVFSLKAQGEAIAPVERPGEISPKSPTRVPTIPGVKSKRPMYPGANAPRTFDPNFIPPAEGETPANGKSMSGKHEGSGPSTAGRAEAHIKPDQLVESAKPLFDSKMLSRKTFQEAIDLLVADPEIGEQGLYELKAKLDAAAKGSDPAQREAALKDVASTIEVIASTRGKGKEFKPTLDFLAHDRGSLQHMSASARTGAAKLKKIMAEELTKGSKNLGQRILDRIRKEAPQLSAWQIAELTYEDAKCGLPNAQSAACFNAVWQEAAKEHGLKADRNEVIKTLRKERQIAEKQG